MSEKYDDYLKSEYWVKVREAVKRRASFRCQVCNSQHDLQAHHRTYEHRGRELEFLDDLTCLCRRCHAIFHGKLVENVAKTEAPTPAKQVKQKVKAIKLGKAKGFIVSPIIDEEIEALMPPEDPIVLTHELVNRTRVNGSFTSATIRALGITNMIKGWPSSLWGQAISRQQYREALRGRHIYAREPKEFLK